MLLQLAAVCRLLLAGLCGKHRQEVLKIIVPNQSDSSIIAPLHKIPYYGYLVDRRSISVTSSPIKPIETFVSYRKSESISSILVKVDSPVRDGEYSSIESKNMTWLRSASSRTVMSRMVACMLIFGGMQEGMAFCLNACARLPRIATPVARLPIRNVGYFRLYKSSSDTEEESEFKAQRKILRMEFFGIALPALIQLAGEPLAGLVDTAYLGRLGPEVLGGAGVAISAHYALAKLYNDPLLRTSISLVAAQDGKNDGTEAEKEGLSVAVSSALWLAAVVGLIQLLVYFVFCSGIIKGMGVGPTSKMWHSALSYLQIRALGTPAATLWLVTNGIFRGLGDTKTPLIFSAIFTALNAVLDPFFIFTLGWGASGAAMGTAISQYVALVPLLLCLKRRIPLQFSMSSLKKSLRDYVSAGGLVLFRTVGKVLAYSVCARQAALLGSTSAAAYNLTFQLGFATTQICESKYVSAPSPQTICSHFRSGIAVAVQTLIARETASSRPRARLLRYLVRGSVVVGGGVALLLSLTTWWRRDLILRGLTTDAAVRAASVSIFPIVLVTQVFKGLAYPVNGIIMGNLDWLFSAITMWAANFTCIGILKWFSLAGPLTLSHIWTSLALFMFTQVVVGIVRYESKRGIWRVLQESQ